MSHIVRKFLEGGFKAAGILTVIFVLARASPVNAAVYNAYSWDDVKSGKVEKAIRDKHNNGYGWEFNYNKSTLKVKDGETGNVSTIDLKEPCKHGRTDTVYRYWFWFKNDMQTVPGAQHWHTDRFVATSKPITNYNCYQYANEGDAIDVPRLEGMEKAGSFVKKTVSSSGRMGLSMYIIDLKEWERSGLQQLDSFSGDIYLQSVISVWYSATRRKAKDLDTFDKWYGAARGLLASAPNGYKDHYNEKVHLTLSEANYIQFYKIEATPDNEKTVIKGNDNKVLAKTLERHWKEVSCYKFSKPAKIRKFNIGDTEYKLRGVKVLGLDKKGEFADDLVHFYIRTGFADDIFMDSSATTTEYSKSTRNLSGEKKNTFANTVYRGSEYFNPVFEQIEDGKKFKFYPNKQSTSQVTYVNPDPPSGERTWRELADYMTDLVLHYSGTCKVYLIYQPLDTKQEVVYKKQTLKYDDEKEDYVSSQAEEVWSKEELKDFTPDTFTLEEAEKAGGDEKKIHYSVYSSNDTRTRIKYYASSVKVTYMKKDDTSGFKTVNVYDFLTDEEKAKFASTIKGTTRTVWNSINDDQEILKKAIKKAYDSLKIEGSKINYEKKITITVQYVQPKTPCFHRAYLKYFDAVSHTKPKYVEISGVDFDKAAQEYKDLPADEKKGFFSYLASKDLNVPFWSGMHYVASSPGSRFGKAVWDEEISLSKVGEKYVVVPSNWEEWPDGGEIKDLPKAKLTDLNVIDFNTKGYLGVTETDKIDEDELPDGSEREKTVEGGTITYNTKTKGNLAYAVFVGSQPSLTVNVWGFKSEIAGTNPPDQWHETYGRDEADWVLVNSTEYFQDTVTPSYEETTITVPGPSGQPSTTATTMVPVEPSHEEDRAQFFKVYTTLKGMVTESKFPNRSNYGLLKDFTKISDPDGILQTGLGVEASPEIYEDTAGKFYVNQAVWEWKAESQAVVDLYYYCLGDGTPKPTPFASSKKTTFTWNDIPKGMGSEKSDGGINKGPMHESSSTNCKIKGIVDKDRGKSTIERNPGVYEIIADSNPANNVSAVNADPSIGADGQITLPNGYMDWSENKYHANMLKTKIDNTAYFSRGTVTRHEESYKFYVEFKRYVTEYWWEPLPMGGQRYCTRTTEQDETWPVTVNTVWFSVDGVGVYEPTNADVWNYAFPNSENGDKVKIDSDGDTRVYTDEWWVSKDYYVRIKKDLRYRMQGRTDSDWDWGNTSLTDTDNGNNCHYINNMKALYLQWLKPITVPLGCIPSTSPFLPDYVPGWIKSGIDVLSDYLWFYHPAWEDTDTGLKLNKTELMIQDWFAFDVTAAEEITVPTKFSYDGLMDIELSSLRIPLSEMTKENEPLLYLDGIRIDQSKLNSYLAGEDPSNKTRISVEYSLMPHYRNVTDETYLDKGWFYSETANRITLHTPIAVYVTIDEWAKDRVQSVLLYEHEALTVGTPFKMSLHYENVFDTPGYGAVDTEPFALEDDTAYFKFPFPVFTRYEEGNRLYNSSDADANVVYHEKDEVFKIYDVSKTTFYTAYWANEAAYDFFVDVEALNVIGQNAMLTVKNRQDRITANENNARRYYRVQDVLDVDVVGTLTDLRITDVGDYPYLEPLFRKGTAEEGKPSYSRTPFAIHSGWKNFVGQTFDSTEASVYPVINGQLLSYLPYNTFKTGYKVRFNVTTIASLFNQNDYVDIKPSFYWVPKSPGNSLLPLLGSSEPQEALVYYDENINGTNRTLVEVGSEMDASNVHQLCIGDPELDIDYHDLIDSANVQGYSQPKDLISKVADAWSYGHVTLPGNVKVSEGKRNSPLLSLATDGVKLGLGTVDDLRLNNCLQNWYGEFYLPDDVHVILKTDKSTMEADATKGYTFNESYWKTNGYLLVRFDVTTYKGDNAHLKYNAQPVDSGYCDMWKVEAHDQSNVRTDSLAQKFKFEEGDFILYDLKSSMSDDYKSGGTH